MAKTFVVDGGNFSAVAFDKVELVNGGDDPIAPIVVEPHWVVGVFANPTGNTVYGSAHASCIAGVSENGSLHCNGQLIDYYPIVIPDGMKRIKVEAPDCWIGMTFSEKDTEGAAAGGVNNVGGFTPSSSTGIGNEHIADVPAGANCFTVSIRKKSGNATEELGNSVTITLLP